LFEELPATFLVEFLDLFLPSRLAMHQLSAYHEFMKNITLTIDDDILQRAEQKASRLDTSVSNVVAVYLGQWADAQDAVEEARRDMSVRFGQPSWHFAVGTADDREQRNARC